MLGRESARSSAVPALCLTVAIAISASAASASVLIFGDRDAARAALEADLTGLGETVTSVESLPADLTPYRVVWHVSAFTPLTSGEQQQLVDFVSAGGGLHLSGEQACCEAMNATLQEVINDLVTGGNIQVGGQLSPIGPYLFNSAALEGVTTTPHLLSAWSPSIPGALSGAIGTDSILAQTPGGQIVGAVWDEDLLVSGRGRLSILMDVDWFTSANRLEIVENLQTFLSVPEPSTLVLLGISSLIGPWRRRR